MPTRKKKTAGGDFCSLIEWKELEAKPWKNGGGTSRELAIYPANSSLAKGNFAWRLSAAEVTAQGPFSTFPDMERLLTLTSGEEILLEFPDLRRTVKSGQVLRFNGEIEVEALLPAGPVSDLGLIYDPDQVLAKFTIIELAGRPRSFSLTSPLVFVHVVRGELSAAVFPGEHEYDLHKGDTLRVGEHAQERVLFLDPGEGAARVIAVEIAEIEVSKN